MNNNSAEIRKLNTFLTGIRDKVKPDKNLMTKIAGIMHAGIERNFLEEGRPEKWKPLAKRTVADRKRKGFGPEHPILQRKQQLLRSIIPRANQNQSIVATNEVYAAIQHFGGVITMPARSELFLRNRYVKGKKKGKFKKGTTRGKGFTFKEHKIVIPPRPFMLFNEPEVDEIIKTVEGQMLS